MGIFIVKLEIMWEFSWTQQVIMVKCLKMIWKTFGKVMSFKIKKLPNLWEEVWEFFQKSDEI